MEDLPKIAQQRLRERGRADTAAPESAGASSRSLGSGHPDADLLTAFADRTLTERERATILSHLAECAACRDVVALASQPVTEVAQPATAVRRKAPWFALPVVRWGAIAAAVGAIVISVVLHRPETLKLRESVVTETKQPPASSPAQPAMQTKSELTKPQAKQLAVAPQQKLGKARPASKETPSTIAHLDATTAKPGAAVGAVAATSGPAEAAPMETFATKPQAAAGTGAGGTVPSPPGTVILSPGQSVTITKMPAPSAEMPAGKTKADKTAEVVTVIQEVPEVEGRRAETEANVSQAGPAPAMLGAASRPARSPQVRMLGAKTGAAKTRWTISASGTVERSEDGGRTWEEIHVASGVVFRALATEGAEMWAGGSKGALYHSSDNGATWTRVTPRSGDNTLSDDVVSMRFPDPQHLILTTASGQQWTSADSGRHWEVQ